MKIWFSRPGMNEPPSGIAVIRSGDSLTVTGSPRLSLWPAVSFTVASISTRAAPWLNGTPGEEIGQADVKPESAVAIGFSSGVSGFEESDVHGRRLDLDFSAAHWFPKEVIGADGSSDVVAGPVASFCLWRPYRPGRRKP